jgi:hypothetical protein
VVWNGKKDKLQLEMDHTANLIFLGTVILNIVLIYSLMFHNQNFITTIDLVKKNYQKLCDTSHKTLDVFSTIAKEIELLGYNFAPTGEASHKLKVKWRNLSSTRKAYIAKISATGSDVDVLKKKPLYYDEIEEILGRLFKES